VSTTLDIIAERTTGTRTIAGTDWPIIDRVWRNGPRSWIYVRGLCNGIPAASSEYRTKREALEAYEWDE